MTRIMPPSIRITATETIIDTDPARDAGAVATFASQRGIVLDGLLAPELTAKIGAVWRKAAFVARAPSVGTRMIELPPRGGQMMQFLLGRKPLLDWLTRVAATPTPVAGVVGGIAQLRAGEGHALRWHNDAGADRLLGITVNLGDAPYEGGLFELRERDRDEILLTHDHKVPGSALVFGIEPNLLHRVTPLTAGGPRTVFTGWLVRGAS
jgi:hypothetical protein